MSSHSNKQAEKQNICSITPTAMSSPFCPFSASFSVCRDPSKVWLWDTVSATLLRQRVVSPVRDRSRWFSPLAKPFSVPIRWVAPETDMLDRLTDWLVDWLTDQNSMEWKWVLLYKWHTNCASSWALIVILHRQLTFSVPGNIVNKVIALAGEFWWFKGDNFQKILAQKLSKIQ